MPEVRHGVESEQPSGTVDFLVEAAGRSLHPRLDDRPIQGDVRQPFGPCHDDINTLGALERGAEKADGKLDQIIAGLADIRLANETRFGATEVKLAGIDAKLDAKASSSIESGIEGRIVGLADKWFVVTAFGTIAAVSTAVITLGPELAALF